MLRIGGGSRRDPADWVTSVQEAVRPYLDRVLSDPDVQASLGAARAAGAEVSRELEGQGPRKAARRLASDRALQARLGAGAQALGDGALALADATRAERRAARLQRVLAVVGLVTLAGLAAVAIARRRGGGSSEAMAEAVEAAEHNGGVEVDAVRPAGSPG